MKTIKIVTFLSFIASAVGLIICFICIKQWNIDSFAIWSFFTGIFISLAFSMIVSWIFQDLNDKNIKFQNQLLIKNIKDKEYNEVKNHLSAFVRQLYLYEDNLIKYLDIGLINSISEYSIDLKELEKNLYVFDCIAKNPTIIKEHKNGEVITICLDRILMRDMIGFIKIGNNREACPLFYTDIYNLIFSCMDLFKRMESINIENKLEVFTKEEITAFSQIDEMPYHMNISPDVLVKVIENIMKIQKFLNCNFYPACRNPDFMKNLTKEWDEIRLKDEKEKKEIEEKMKDAQKYIDEHF